MVIIGELINTSRKRIDEAVENRDAVYIGSLAKKQADAGAAYIDINAGSRLESELTDLEWLIDVVENAVDLPLSLDSPSSEVLYRGLKKVTKRPIINSISAEKARWNDLRSLLEEESFDLVALCLSDHGIPKATEEIAHNAETILERLESIGFDSGRVLLDPLIQPLSTNSGMGSLALNSISELKQKFKSNKIICGVSNISYGLPKRQLINRHFLILAMMAGLDAAIIDPTDQKLMCSLFTTELILGRDNYCLNYLNAFRAEKLLS